MERSRHRYLHRTLGHWSKINSRNRKVRGHSPKEYLSRDLTAIEIFQCLYVDDGAFIFSTRDNLIRGIGLVHHHFTQLGLEMHIGRGTTSSKTECVFFPPPRFFNSMLPSALIQEINETDENNMYHDAINNALTETKQQQEETI